MPQGASGGEPSRPLRKERRLFPSPASTAQREGEAEEEKVGVEEASSIVVVVVIPVSTERRLSTLIFPSSFSSLLLRATATLPQALLDRGCRTAEKVDNGRESI